MYVTKQRAQPRPMFSTDAFLCTAARIKKNKSKQIKFKVRCQRHLYTLVLTDSDKAEKLKQSLPPCMELDPPISECEELTLESQPCKSRRSPRRTNRSLRHERGSEALRCGVWEVMD